MCSFGCECGRCCNCPLPTMSHTVHIQFRLCYESTTMAAMNIIPAWNIEGDRVEYILDDTFECRKWMCFSVAVLSNWRSDAFTPEHSRHFPNECRLPWTSVMYVVHFNLCAMWSWPKRQLDVYKCTPFLKSEFGLPSGRTTSNPPIASLLQPSFRISCTESSHHARLA